MRHLIVFALAMIILLPASSGQLFSDARETLNAFLSTSFFWEYEKAKRAAEKSALEFKQDFLYRYSEEEVTELADAYNVSAEYFNNVLFNIKRDMLNKDIRKYMTKFPELYAKQIELDLIRAQEYYENNFQSKLRRLLGDEEAGIPITQLVSMITTYVKGAVGIFKKIKQEMRKFNEGMIDKHLIQPYRFRMWDEIGPNQN